MSPTRPTTPLLLAAALILTVGCSRSDSQRQEPPAASGTIATAPVESAPARDSLRTASIPRVVFLGDSLTAGYGLSEEEAFPAVIARRLAQRGMTIKIVNAGVSGDTTAGGLARVAWVLRQRPDVLVVGLGGNDGLRGLSPEMTEENLRAIVLEAGKAGAHPILLGMRLPPNLGAEYVRAFESIYPRLARELDIALVPFMLEGVAGDPTLNLPDGIHPTAEGQQIVADNVLPWVDAALASLTDDSAEHGPEQGATHD